MRQDKHEAAVWGLCFGDALSRTHSYKAPAFLLHGATGTWFLTLLETTQQSVASDAQTPWNGLKESLARRLQFLGTPFHGTALRSKARSLGATLRLVAQHYSKYRNLDSAASSDLNGDVLPCAIALGIVKTGDETRSRLLIESLTLTHRHPRVISAAALLCSAWCEWSEDADRPLHEVLTKGESFALATLELISQSADDKDARQNLALAKQALLHHVALGRGVAQACDLGFPYGFDGRDSPEQMVVLTLAMAASHSGSAPLQLFELLDKGGASDILAPIFASLCGLRAGFSAFLPEWSPLLLSHALWKRRLPSAELRAGPSIAEEELELSLQEEARFGEAGVLPTTVALKEQLAFL